MGSANNNLEKLFKCLGDPPSTSFHFSPHFLSSTGKLCYTETTIQHQKKEYFYLKEMAILFKAKKRQLDSTHVGTTKSMHNNIVFVGGGRGAGGVCGCTGTS